MIPIEQEKVVILVPPQLDTAAAPASLTYIDTLGYSHLRVEYIIGANDIATTAAPKLQSCTASGGTYADISGAALAAAISATDDGKVFAIDVDLTKSVDAAGAAIERYIKTLITCGTTSTAGTALCVLGRLSRKSSGQHNGLATDSGLEELVSV